MSLNNHIIRFGMIAFASMAFFLMTPANAKAEEMPESEFAVLAEGQHYTGSINSISPEQALVIIDDRSFVLDRVIRFNSATWSREQVLNRIQPGNSVRILVGELIDQSRGARLITELKVLN